ncbi:MAG: hypothetical protein CL623_06000 [Arcobacter sp.]|nr:hypothetical protein [Arcobacter sp.]|tara:strand:+ start:3008 stop:3808 length:801 start_codon:yes stop_codon:yes gene_type:complete
MSKYIYLIFIIFFTACSTTSPNKETIKEVKEVENFTKKEYKDISKDAIFEASKKLFLFADKKQFRIDSYRDHLEVSKTKMSHFFFYPVTHEDRWNLTVDEKDNISFAKLELVRITDFNEDNVEYLSKYNHELFWSRLDYLLGLSDKWLICDSVKNVRGTLCDSIDMYTKTTPTKDDIVKNILISERKKTKNLNEINDDILNEDIEFALDETKDDLLGKENISDNQTNEEKTLDDELNKEIEELDKKVNSNIDKTLDRIKNDIKDEQ